MADIKKKENNSKQIKKLDKTKIYSQRMKNKIINAKEKELIQDNTNDSNEEENSPTEYGINKIADNSKVISKKGFYKAEEYGKKSVAETKDNIVIAKIKATNKIKQKLYDRNIKEKSRDAKDILENIENENNARNNLKQEFQNLKKVKDIKFSKNRIKNVPQSMSIMPQMNVKNKNEINQESIKGFKKTYHIAKVTAENVRKKAEKTIRTMILAIKAILKATKALVFGIMALGSVSIFIIVIVCFIALICSSAMGIFFSNEMTGKGRTMNSVVTELNTEFTQKITDIQLNTAHDEYEIHSNRAEWKDMLTIYSVVVTGGNDQSNVMILDDKNVETLKKVFWSMNEIHSRTANVVREIQIINKDNSVTIQKQVRKVLYIDITSKSVDQMVEEYHFNRKQRTQLAEIRKEKYNGLWANVLYGSLAGSTDIVQVAFSQIGNAGGEKFWRWYGFNDRVEWCATFVSWCANECGYIDAGIIPKFAACHNEGIAWFQACGLWQERGYTPKSRRYNLF